MAVLLFIGAAARAQPQAVFELLSYRKTVALQATVNGQEGLFLLDTAGGITLLSPSFAKAVGCTPWGRLSGFQMMGQRLDGPRCDGIDFQLGGQAFHAPVTLVLDIAPLVAPDAAPVAGSIALDLFAGRTITVDIPGRRLIVESPASLQQRVGDTRPLPLLLSRELQGRALAASLGVATAKGMLWFELDTGNGGTLLVSKPYAFLFGLDPQSEGPQQADFPVAPGLRAQGRAFTPDMILDGNLGMPFLRDKVITLDLQTGRLWMTVGKP
ncbi:MAG: aspartyl protease family protein [Burkholderiales bacterium]